MAVSSQDRNHFIAICLEKVSELGGNRSSGIPVQILCEMRDMHNANGGELGKIFESAVKVMEEAEGRFFYFREFNEYYLVRLVVPLQPSDSSLDCSDEETSESSISHRLCIICPFA